MVQYIQGEVTGGRPVDGECIWTHALQGCDGWLVVVVDVDASSSCFGKL